MSTGSETPPAQRESVGRASDRAASGGSRAAHDGSIWKPWSSGPATRTRGLRLGNVDISSWPTGKSPVPHHPIATKIAHATRSVRGKRREGLLIDRREY